MGRLLSRSIRHLFQHKPNERWHQSYQVVLFGRAVRVGRRASPVSELEGEKRCARLAFFESATKQMLLSLFWRRVTAAVSLAKGLVPVSLGDLLLSHWRKTSAAAKRDFRECACRACWRRFWREGALVVAGAIILGLCWINPLASPNIIGINSKPGWFVLCLRIVWLAGHICFQVAGWPS